MPIDGTSGQLETSGLSASAESSGELAHVPTHRVYASRRTLLKGAAVTGIGAATAGVVADILFAGPASAATQGAASSGDALVAHVRDVKSGHIDLYVGTRQVSVQNRSLAADLARAVKEH